MLFNNKYLITLVILVLVIASSFTRHNDSNDYLSYYNHVINGFSNSQLILLKSIEDSDLHSSKDIGSIKEQIALTRNHLKAVDFWLRYLEPLAQKKINGPLPIEWETEVFEKFEKPYKREGAGLTLAELYLDEKHIEKDSLLHLIQLSLQATKLFGEVSITSELKSYHHFYLCNRLFLLNLAAIYTTGFECPDTANVIPELRYMLANVKNIYQSFNESFPDNRLTYNYFELYKRAMVFVDTQPSNLNEFDHFTFIKDFVNPLFIQNQTLIRQYHVTSKSLVDYSLSKNSNSIFDKTLYNAQNSKGIFIRVKDQNALAEIDHIGKLLFYDPILSGNNLRSCASCHNPTQHFTDTTSKTSFQFNHLNSLTRNTPSLINVEFNHLLMLDGKHISLQAQTKEVITNALEMGSNQDEVLAKILSCKQYKVAFNKLLPYTPQEKKITFDHIVSALTYYYTKFSYYYSPFDEAMNESKNIEASVKRGFNLFMGKGQCATCHFVPQFNGVKPPFVSSEFEVLGVPENLDNKILSDDRGRSGINDAPETLNAFRTGSLRNASYTKPYMHNGVFKTLSEVIDFYDAGGGLGRGLKVDNQTLSSDSLHLTKVEKEDLISFIKSLNEKIVFENPPEKLPLSKIKTLNTRKVGGVY